MRRNQFAGVLIASGIALVGISVWNTPGTHRPATPALHTTVGARESGDEPRGRRMGARDQLPGVSSSMVALPGGATAAITIPKLGVKAAPVFERGVDGQGNMLIAPGYTITHFSFSPGLGAGNSVLYGHDDIEGSIFAHLQDLRPGDDVEVATPEGVQTYRVTERKIVWPTAVEILNPTDDVRLTIFTCWPTWVDNQRVVITAKPIS